MTLSSSPHVNVIVIINDVISINGFIVTGTDYAAAAADADDDDDDDDKCVYIERPVGSIARYCQTSGQYKTPFKV